MNKIQLALGTVALTGVTLTLASCAGESTTTPESPSTPKATQPEAPKGMSLEDAVAKYGEPCKCVTDNLNAMRELAEVIQATPEMGGQDINIQIAQKMLPCMKSTGEEHSMEYSSAMSQCEGQPAFLEVMSEITSEIRERSKARATQGRDAELGGAKSAKEVLDKLQGN